MINNKKGLDFLYLPGKANRQSERACNVLCRQQNSNKNIPVNQKYTSTIIYIDTNMDMWIRFNKFLLKHLFVL